MTDATTRNDPAIGDTEDSDSAERRSRERYKRAALTTVSAIGARGITIATTIVTTPLALQYLGPERYGMWMTISSVVVLLGLSDLGIGNGVMNEVAHASAIGDHRRESQAVWSGFALLALVAGFLGLAFLVAGPAIRWDQFFGVESPKAMAEAGPATAVFIGSFLIALPLSLGNQVRIAHQQGYVLQTIAVVTSVIGAVLMILAIVARQGLPILVLAVAGPPVVGSLANAIAVSFLGRPWLRPSRSAVDLRVAVHLLRKGALFFVLQIAIAVGFASDSIVAARVIGPVAVAEYSVTQRLFNVPLLLIYATLGPLWPAYRDAISRGDLGWARQALRRSVRLGLAISVPSAIVLAVAALPIIRLWVGTSVEPPWLLVLGFALWIVLNAFGTAVAMFLNGAGEILAQAVTATAMAIVNLGLSIFLAGRIGVAGVMWGTVIAYSLFSLLPMAIYLPRVMRRIERAHPGERGLERLARGTPLT